MYSPSQGCLYAIHSFHPPTETMGGSAFSASSHCAWKKVPLSTSSATLRCVAGSQPRPQFVQFSRVSEKDIGTIGWLATVTFIIPDSVWYGCGNFHSIQVNPSGYVGSEGQSGLKKWKQERISGLNVPGS